LALFDKAAKGVKRRTLVMPRALFRGHPSDSPGAFSIEIAENPRTYRFRVTLIVLLLSG
jgi:hypothetical protein